MNTLYLLTPVNDINGSGLGICYFLLFASGLAGILVIICKNPVISVLYLISMFLNIACYLLILGLNFIALPYLLLYVGAVSILFIFIMLINVRALQRLNSTSYTITLPGILPSKIKLSILIKKCVLCFFFLICFSYCLYIYILLPFVPIFYYNSNILSLFISLYNNEEFLSKIFDKETLQEFIDTISFLGLNMDCFSHIYLGESEDKNYTNTHDINKNILTTQSDNSDSDTDKRSKSLDKGKGRAIEHFNSDSDSIADYDTKHVEADDIKELQEKFDHDLALKLQWDLFAPTPKKEPNLAEILKRMETELENEQEKNDTTKTDALLAEQLQESVDSMQASWSSESAYSVYDTNTISPNDSEYTTNQKLDLQELDTKLRLEKLNLDDKEKQNLDEKGKKKQYDSVDNNLIKNKSSTQNVESIASSSRVLQLETEQQFQARKRKFDEQLELELEQEKREKTAKKKK